MHDTDHGRSALRRFIRSSIDLAVDDEDSLAEPRMSAEPPKPSVEVAWDSFRMNVACESVTPTDVSVSLFAESVSEIKI